MNGIRTRELPQALDLVIVEKRIGTYDGNAQQLGLGHQHSIKRIAVVRR